MTKINPYWIVKQAKRTEFYIKEPGFTYSDGTYVPPVLGARDIYTTKELPFFNKYWMRMPNNGVVHLSELSLPLLGGLIGAYTGKGAFNKVKNGLLGALAGTGIHAIGQYSGLRDKLITKIFDYSKPMAELGKDPFPFNRVATQDEANKYWEKAPRIQQIFD